MTVSAIHYIDLF